MNQNFLSRAGVSYCKSRRLGIVIIINKNYRNSIVGGEQKQKKNVLADVRGRPPPLRRRRRRTPLRRRHPRPRRQRLGSERFLPPGLEISDFFLFLIWNDWSGSISLKSDLIPFFSILSGCVVEFFFPPLYVNASLWWVVGWSLITPISSCFVIIVGVGNLGFWIWGLVDSHESCRMLCCVQVSQSFMF